MTKPPEFVLHLRPEPGVDPLLALRSLLKVALRAHGLRCVALRREPPVLNQASQRRVAKPIIIAHND